MADLCREVNVPCKIGFMRAKSYYNSTVSSGDVKITMDFEEDITEYHLVIVEDIIYTCQTLNCIVNQQKAHSPLSLTVITLLDKPSRRVVPFKPDIALFNIPDIFVIGYGMDYSEYFRNLPCIAEYNQE